MRASEKTFVTALTVASLLAAPLVVSAQTLSDLLGTMTRIVLLATPFAAGLLYFFWNLASLLFTLDDAEKKKQARARVVYGVIALFVLFTVGGLVAVFQRTIFGPSATGGVVPAAHQSTNPLSPPGP